MNLRTSLTRFAAGSAAAAVVLALAACGSGTVAPLAPAAPTTAGASGTSAVPDRQAAAGCSNVVCLTKTVIIRNNLDYPVLIDDVFGVDNNDWASSRRPDHAPAVGLAGQLMNPHSHVTRLFDINANNTVVPFGFHVFDGRNLGRQLAKVEFDIHSMLAGSSCGWTFRDLAGSNMDRCGDTVTRTVDGFTITVTSGSSSITSDPTTIVLG